MERVDWRANGSPAVVAFFASLVERFSPVSRDALLGRMVRSLSPALTDRERRALTHGVPATAVAYELYLGPTISSWRAKQRFT